MSFWNLHNNMHRRIYTLHDCWSLQKEFFHFLTAPQLQTVFEVTQTHCSLSFSSRKRRKLRLTRKRGCNLVQFDVRRRKGCFIFIFKTWLQALTHNMVTLCCYAAKTTLWRQNVPVKYQSLLISCIKLCKTSFVTHWQRLNSFAFCRIAWFLFSRNRPFARSGHMVRDSLRWDASYTVGLPKQRNSYQSSPTFLCFELGVSPCKFLPSMINSVPCDRFLQRAYCLRRGQVKTCKFPLIIE